MAAEKITKDMLIGEIIEKYPAAEDVFRRYFGSGCFTCPGSQHEDIYFGAGVHNVDPDEVVDELNRVLSGD